MVITTQQTGGIRLEIAPQEVAARIAAKYPLESVLRLVGLCKKANYAPETMTELVTRIGENDGVLEEMFLELFKESTEFKNGELIPIFKNPNLCLYNYKLDGEGEVKGTVKQRSYRHLALYRTTDVDAPYRSTQPTGIHLFSDSVVYQDQNLKYPYKNNFITKLFSEGAVTLVTANLKFYPPRTVDVRKAQEKIILMDEDAPQKQTLLTVYKTFQTEMVTVINN